jgi:hypothetical protein
MIKKLFSPLTKSLPPLKLYLNDLEHVEWLAKDSDILSNISFFSDEYEFDSVSDMAGSKQKVFRKLLIVITTKSNTSISINLNRTSGNIYLGSADLAAERRLFEQLLNYLRKRWNWPITLWFYVPLGSMLLMFLAALIFGLLSIHLATVCAVVGILISFLGVLVGIFLGGYRSTTIFLTRRSDSPSFWERNWEKIVVGVITLIIGVLLGWLAKFLPGPPGK